MNNSLGSEDEYTRNFGLKKVLDSNMPPKDSGQLTFGDKTGNNTAEMQFEELGNDNFESGAYGIQKAPAILSKLTPEIRISKADGHVDDSRSPMVREDVTESANINDTSPHIDISDEEDINDSPFKKGRNRGNSNKTIILSNFYMRHRRYSEGLEH